MNILSFKESWIPAGGPVGIPGVSLRRQGLAPLPACCLMISAPEGSFRSAARSAASSGLLDSAGAGFAGGRADFFCLGADASGFDGAILSSDGAISFKARDGGGFVVVGMSAANAGKAKPAMTKPIADDRTMLMLLFMIGPK